METFGYRKDLCALTPDAMKHETCMEALCFESIVAPH